MNDNSRLRLRNAFLSVPTISFKNITDNEFLDYLETLPYLQGENSYLVFQREMSEAKGEHWQCYFEFNQQVYFNTLKRDFNSSHIERRKGLREQTIKYCKKEKTRISGPYEKGKPKKKKEKKDKKNVLNEIIEKIKSNNYSNFFEIEEENLEIFEANKKLLKDVWNRNNPIVFWDTKPARVIWCFGEKGSGKTVWTEKYLRTNNYKIGEIVTIFPNSITYNDQIKFEIDDEKGKVLVINEVDENFPKNNNLISFIDRRGFLEAKESKIRNNFELIIINSLYKPEEVFGYLGKKVAGQVLRRIFSPFFDCKVYQIKQNKKQLNNFLKLKIEMSSIEFQDWYNPTIKEISEPNYNLIEKE